MCFVCCSWKAANYSQFWGMSLDEGLRYRLGTRRPSRAIMSMNEIQVSGEDAVYTVLHCTSLQLRCLHIGGAHIDQWDQNQSAV